MAAPVSGPLAPAEALPALQLPSDEGMRAIEVHRAKFYAKRRNLLSFETDDNDSTDFTYSPFDSDSRSPSASGEERANEPASDGAGGSGLAKCADGEEDKRSAVVAEEGSDAPTPLQYKVLGRGDDYMAISTQIEGKEWTGMLYCLDNGVVSTSNAKDRLQQLCRNDAEDVPLDQWSSMLVDRQLLPNRQRRYCATNWAKWRGRMVCYSCLCVVPEEKTMPFVCNCRERQRQRASRSRNLRPGAQQQLNRRTREVVVAKLENRASIPPWSVVRTVAAPTAPERPLTPRTSPVESPRVQSKEQVNIGGHEEKERPEKKERPEGELESEPSAGSTALSPPTTTGEHVSKEEAMPLRTGSEVPASSPTKLPENRVVTRSASKRMSGGTTIAGPSSRSAKRKATPHSANKSEPLKKKPNPGIAMQLKLKAIKLANIRARRKPTLEALVTAAAEIPQYVIRSSGEEAPLKITLLKVPSSSPSSLSPRFNPITPASTAEPHESTHSTAPIVESTSSSQEVRKSPRKCTSQRMESIIASLKSRSHSNPPRSYNPFGSAQAQKNSPNAKRQGGGTKSNSSELLAEKDSDATPKTRTNHGGEIFDFRGGNSGTSSPASTCTARLDPSPDEVATRGERIAYKHGFQIGDLVWARTPNLPYWPGEVTELIDEDSLIVAWCGENTHNPVQVSTVDRFLPAFPQRFQPTSSSLKKKFCMAVAEALVLAQVDAVSLDGRLNWWVAQHLSQQHGWNLDGLRVYRGGGKKWTEFKPLADRDSTNSINRADISSATPSGSLR